MKTSLLFIALATVTGSAFSARCTMQAAHRQESAAYWSAGYTASDCGRQAERPGAAPKKRQCQTGY